jgi:hypothetical protein
MAAASTQYAPPAAGGEVDVPQLLARLRTQVEAMRREMLTPKARNRARLIAREIRALERDLVRDGLLPSTAAA